MRKTRIRRSRSMRKRRTRKQKGGVWPFGAKKPLSSIPQANFNKSKNVTPEEAEEWLDKEEEKLGYALDKAKTVSDATEGVLNALTPEVSDQTPEHGAQLEETANNLENNLPKEIPPFEKVNDLFKKVIEENPNPTYSQFINIIKRLLGQKGGGGWFLGKKDKWIIPMFSSQESTPLNKHAIFDEADAAIKIGYFFLWPLFTLFITLPQWGVRFAAWTLPKNILKLAYYAMAKYYSNNPENLTKVMKEVNPNETAVNAVKTTVNPLAAARPVVEAEPVEQPIILPQRIKVEKYKPLTKYPLTSTSSAPAPATPSPPETRTPYTRHDSITGSVYFQSPTGKTTTPIPQAAVSGSWNLGPKGKWYMKPSS